MTEAKRPLKVFLCHAHIIPLRDSDKDAVKALDGRVGGVLPPYRDHTRRTKDGVDAWLDKEKPCGERSAVLSLSKHRTILPGQGFDRLNLPDWELEIRRAVREIAL